MLPGRGEVLPPPCLSRPPFGWKNLLYQRYYYYRLGILASVPWVGRASEEADVELGGHVVEAGDLVGAWASGEEGTLGGVKQLLHNKKTVTLV